MKRAEWVIANDSGPMHLAAALGVRVLGIFGPTDPQRNGPWHGRDLSISRYDRCVCHYERRCRRTHGWCLGEIAVDEVATAIQNRVAS